MAFYKLIICASACCWCFKNATAKCSADSGVPWKTAAIPEIPFFEDSRKLAKLMLISWDKPAKNCDQVSYFYFIVKLHWQNLSTDFNSLPCFIYNTRKWRRSLQSLWAYPLSSCDCAISYLTAVLVVYLCPISQGLSHTSLHSPTGKNVTSSLADALDGTNKFTVPNARGN